MMPDVIWYQLAGLGFIQVAGPDARDYLNRMTTNATKHVPAGDIRRNLLLRGDGRMVGDFYLICEDSSQFLIISPSAAREGLLAQLDMFVFTEKVELEDRALSNQALCLKGNGASAALDRLCPATATGNQLRSGDGVSGFLCPDAPLSRAKVILWGTPDRMREVMTELEEAFGPELDSAIISRLRIEDSEPLFGIDMDSTTIPLEAGLDHAIDFNKGCFPGQEVVARIENLGHPANVLVGLVGPAMEAGSLLFAGEKQTGRITTAAPAGERRDWETIALGYVKWDQRLPGTAIDMQGANGRVPAEVIELPLQSAPGPLE